MKRFAVLLAMAALIGACGLPTAWKPPASATPTSASFEPFGPSPSPSPPSTPSPTPGHQGPVRLITIVLSAQHLTAYEDSKVIVSTDVTTGRPGMETPVGTHHIMEKYSPYRFISPWPRGDPNYFDPLDVKWAMLFAAGGYFIHDAWWQQNWGPGANTKSGSHGCVNMPESAMGTLYQWAQVGDEVIVSQ